MIDYNVRIWPPERTEKVINLGINYFKLDNAGRILYENFKSLNDNVLGIENKRYTMPTPVNYYQAKYPESRWFQ